MQIIPILLTSLLSFTLIMGKPQRQQQPNDQELSNRVNPDRKEEEVQKTVQSPATPEIYENNLNRPGAGVTRIIDDIFQIPIGVLQSVSRLLKNPFISQNKTPETVSSY